MATVKTRRTPDFESTYSRWLDTPALNPDDVFARLIQSDKSLCANCFSTRWDIEAEDFYAGSETGWHRYERFYPIPGRNCPDALPNQRHDGSPRACASCGFESGRDRPLSDERAARYAHNLSVALTERDVAHDTRTLIDTVIEQKHKPENQSYSEDAIWGTAVAVAVRFERRRS